MFQLLRTGAFERDVKHFLARGGGAENLREALTALRAGPPLPPWLRDHALKGRLHRCRELHVEPDCLLVYEKDGKKFRILCLWLTTHKRLKERERSL